MTKWNRVLTLCFGLLAMGSVGGFSVQEAVANPITYTQTGHLTGTIGSTAFTDAAVTLTTVTDTANLVDLSSIAGNPTFFNPGLTTIDIAGVGVATFSGDSFGSTTQQYVTQQYGTINVVGFLDSTTLKNIFFTFTPTLYDGVSDFTHTGIGYIYGGTGGTYQTTSMGDLTITGVSGNSTFTAVTSATVPEPSSLALMGLGGLGLAVRTIRRRRTSVGA